MLLTGLQESVTRSSFRVLPTPDNIISQMNALAAADDGGPVQAVEFSWATQGGALESGVDDVIVDTDFDSPAPNLPPHLLTIIEADNAVVDHDEIIFEQRADGPIELATQEWLSLLAVVPSMQRQQSENSTRSRVRKLNLSACLIKHLT